MPKKSILISSGSAKRTAVASNKFTYDTNTKYVSVDNISSSQFVLTGAVSGVLISSGGVVTAYKASENSGSYLITDGFKWTVGSAENASIGIVGGDLSGSYPNPTFKNIGNVNTGSLRVARGGFSGSNNYNILSVIPSGSLILASSTGSLTAVSTASYNNSGNAWVLASISGTSQWAAVTASAPERDVNVQYFTCSATLTSSIQIWTKQNPNHQWARVMLQGGGGAGGIASNAPYGTGGGGSGGFTDIVININNINTASITVGAGGYGGTGQAPAVFPTTAASSSFSASNIFVSAGAGGAGGAGAINVTTAGTGGIGLTYSGADGGIGGGSSPSTAQNGNDNAGSGGGAGFNAGAGTIKTGGTGGLYTYNLISPTGPSANANTNIYGYTIPVGFSSGCGGNSKFGLSGSGGCGMNGNIANPRAGSGGDGWVVIVSY